MTYEVVIGLEVHAQLKTKTKLFCASSTEFGCEPNTNVSPICLGLPGALPVLNKRAVDLAIIAGLALDCDIQNTSIFARKNYFYPDLPKGYQISQFDHPICLKGHLDIHVGDDVKRIGITRIHMEEDAGKLVHQGADAISGSEGSYVDLNRAGIPLIEIVSEPDIRSAEEARVYMETLRQILAYMEVCECDLEKGHFRADANVSIRPVGSPQFGTRTEVKNLNSFRSLERAILYEIERQTRLVESGGVVVQQTLHFDDGTGETSALRSKEEAHDYRYFPEPDLKPLIVTDDHIETLRASMSELPRQKQVRYRDDYQFSPHEIKVLIGDRALNTFFESCIEMDPAVDKKVVCKWLVGDFVAFVKSAEVSVSSVNVSPKDFGLLMRMLSDNTVSGKMAKTLLEKMIETGESPQQLLDQMGGGQISDTDELRNVVTQVMTQNRDVVDKIKAGKTRSVDFLMGQVMKETRGRAKPDLVRQLILDLVDTV